MDQSKRKPLIAGNWKMNVLPSRVPALMEEMKAAVAGADCRVALCVPYVDLAPALAAAAGSCLAIGAQNCHWAEGGAFTGEIAPGMLGEMGVAYVILGHSERRQYFGETDETVAKRLRGALDGGLSPILCVGETLGEREDGSTAQVVTRQTVAALAGVSEEELSRVVLAYEPVWAIGTGKTATSEEAEEVCALLRRTVAESYGEAAAQGLPILYGGSMNAANAAELLGKPDVDGGLIGGASLKAADFGKIVAAAR